MTTPTTKLLMSEQKRFFSQYITNLLGKLFNDVYHKDKAYLVASGREAKISPRREHFRYGARTYSFELYQDKYKPFLFHLTFGMYELLDPKDKSMTRAPRHVLHRIFIPYSVIQDEILFPSTIAHWCSMKNYISNREFHEHMMHFEQTIVEEVFLSDLPVYHITPTGMVKALQLINTHLGLLWNLTNVQDVYFMLKDKERGEFYKYTLFDTEDIEGTSIQPFDKSVYKTHQLYWNELSKVDDVCTWAQTILVEIFRHNSSIFREYEGQVDFVINTKDGRRETVRMIKNGHDIGWEDISWKRVMSLLSPSM